MSHLSLMTDPDLDAALIAAAFAQAGRVGWRRLDIVAAAREADLPLDRVRARFPSPIAVLVRFGTLADATALAEVSGETAVREHLFDLLMRRFDLLQAHREGVLALLRVLPTDPVLSATLAAATTRSMVWMLQAAGAEATGLRGMLRAQGLTGVWLYAVRAWREDESADLAGTMAALDKALDGAERLAGMFGLSGNTTTAGEQAIEAESSDELSTGATMPPPPPPPEVPPASPPV